MRIHLRTVISIETGEVLEDCWYEYYGPIALLKVSDAEKQAQAQSAAESKQLQQMMTVQFKEQQDLLNKVLIPQLEQMASNPEGFGAKALAAMQSQLINTVGTQVASQEKSLNNQFATENMAGLSSGVEAALQANLGASAAGAEASGLSNIAIENAQLKNQQQEFGLSGLSSATSLLGQAPGTAGLAIGANQNSFNQAKAIATQGSLWQNLLGGVVGAGLNFATGGVGNLDTTGGSTAGEQLGNFFGGGAAAIA